MGRGPATFRKRDLRVATEVAARIGGSVEARKDGTIIIRPGKAGEANGAGESANPWDKVLSDDADEKRAS